MKFSLTTDSQTGERDLFVKVDDELYHANSETNPQFDSILANVRSGYVRTDMFNVEQAIASKFRSLSERLAITDGEVYFDGDVQDNVFAEHLLRMIADGTQNWGPLVPFYENVQNNPLEHTRTNLYMWLAAERFTIDSDGMILGYKGLRQDETSITAGPAFVNGEPFKGNVPNHDGNVITMARSTVEHNPAVGCSRGLHVGTWEYASGFAQGVVKLVKFNPRDVVSVPTDCDFQKLRTARYEVVRTVTEPLTAAVV